MDWLLEKNLDLEDRTKATRGGNAKRDDITYKGGTAQLDGTGGERVTIDPDLTVTPNPDFVAWRERLWQERRI